MQESRQPTFNLLKAAHNILGYGTRLFAYLRGQKSEKKTQTHELGDDYISSDSLINIEGEPRTARLVQLILWVKV
ncbi:hypothetical protein KCU78_g22834, partial [Aureobasidium melanogenum]